MSRYLDVPAANAEDSVLLEIPATMHARSDLPFLDPAAKRVHPDWDEVTALAGGGLREHSANNPDNPRLLALISELSSCSE